ncbi:MAG TPA: translocation/assembly module TamB domain-containing protein [Terracidiphilus sp.]|jgi:translocation and assembly module TamB|nr:translocation/assembly module TamB domain-containing protein [Terracidiphilus sp.]
MSAARTLFPPEPPPEPNPPQAIRPARHCWRRFFAWAGGILVLLIAIVVVAVAVLLHSQRFHNYILAKVQTAATEDLGTRVDLQNFAVNFSNLTLDIYGVTVHGASPYPDPPLLQLQHAEVGIQIVSILHKKWYLSSFRLDHPVVQVFVDKNGVSNLPKPKPSNSKSNTSIFDLGIRHAILDQGEVYYNSQSTPLWADLHDVEFRASFNDLVKMYSGNLQYTNGRVVFGAYQPFLHNFAARFDLTPTTFQLHRANISSAAAQINLVATATNFSAPHVDAKYDITLDGGQMAKLMRDPSVPQGLVHAAGSATYQQMANQPALNTLTVNGDLNSKQLVVKTPSLRAAIDNLAAHYSLANGDATLHDLRAGILGGELTAQGSMKQIGGNSHSEMTASLRHISLAQANGLVASRSKQPVALTGELNADAKASWGKTFNDLVAKTDATIRAQATGKHPAAASNGNAANAAPPAPATVPVNGEVHATYTGAHQEIALANTYLQMPQTTLTLNGVVSKHSSVAVRLQSNDLRELALVADMFRTPAPGQAQPQPLDLAGAASFQGNVQGSTSAPRLTGQLAATNLRVNGSTWKVFRTSVDLSPSQARLLNADLEPQPKGRITLNASVGLNKWSFSNTSPIQLDLNASQMDIASLTKLAGQQIPVTGTLNTHVALHGTELNPVGSGTLSVTNATAYNEPISSLQVNFGGTGDQAQANLSVKLPAGSIQSNVTVRPKEKTYTAQLSSTGIQIDKLETVKSQNLDAAGVVAIQASGQGSFDNPQLTASIQVPSLTIQKQTAADIRLNASLANHVANATLASSALHTNIQAKARVNLTGNYDTDATLDTQNIPLQPMVALFSPANAEALSGQTELHATVRGPIKNKAALEAHVTIPYLNVAYNKTIQLASAAPIHADYKNSVLTLQHSTIKGTDTNLEFQGSIPLGSKGPMSLLLRGNIDLQLAQIFNPDIRTSGDLRFNIDSHGAALGDIGGEIDIVNASYASGDLPVGLQNGNGVLKLTTDRLNIQSFQGTIGGGTVTASGGVAYRPAIQFNLGMAAKDIRMLYPQGMRESINANIHLAGTTDDAVLGGDVDLANVSFTPAFDLSTFAAQFGGGVASPPSLGITQNIRLNLGVHSTNNVALVSRTLSIDGSANLRVRGTAANPVILGRVNLIGGDMILNGDRFLLSGGTIQFVNPSETQPVVNITVTTSIQQYNISMRFQGPADQLRTQYTSDPSLPEADIIHLLAFGETTEAAANSPATANQMAESLVANQVSSQITGRVAKVAGISQLSISPVLGNASNQQAGANITIQQRVTGNLFVTFSTNTAQSTQTIQGQYKISPKVSLSATRDPNGGFAVDALIKKSY